MQLAEPGITPSFRVSNKAHNEGILPNFDGLQRAYPGSVEPPQVPHLLLGPQSDHFPWVLGVATTETAFARDITVSVFEDEDGRFVDLDGEVGLGG